MKGNSRELVRFELRPLLLRRGHGKSFSEVLNETLVQVLSQNLHEPDDIPLKCRMLHAKHSRRDILCDFMR